MRLQLFKEGMEVIVSKNPKTSIRKYGASRIKREMAGKSFKIFAINIHKETVVLEKEGGTWNFDPSDIYCETEVNEIESVVFNPENLMGGE